MPRESSMSGRARGSRLARGIVLAIVLLASLEVLYLVAGNVIIRTSLLRSWINDGPERTHVAYTSARTFWPGFVHVTGLRIWDRDESVEWRIALDEGEARIGLLDLMRRHFHTSFLKGNGLVLRIRTRLTPSQATPHELSLLPDIPEFPEPPVRDPAAREEEPPSSRIWIIDLDGVE